jgi:hypothetical protein
MNTLYLTATENASLVGISELTPDGLTAKNFLEQECDILVVVDDSKAISHRRKLKSMGKSLDTISVTAKALDHATKLAVAGGGNDIMKKLVGIIEDQLPLMLCPFITMYPSIPSEVVSATLLPITLQGVASTGVYRGIHVTTDTDNVTVLESIWCWPALDGTATCSIQMPTVAQLTNVNIQIAQAVRVDYASTVAGGGSYDGEDPMQWLHIEKLTLKVKPV